MRQHKVQLKDKALNRIVDVSRPFWIERYHDTLYG